VVQFCICTNLKIRIRSALHYLSDRKSLIAKNEAKILLKDKDKYIWLNAAFYLGAIKEKESIPYLIKGLKHPAYRSYDKIVDYLKMFSKEDFGKDQEKWIAWWTNKNPTSTFDFKIKKKRGKRKK